MNKRGLKNIFFIILLVLYAFFYRKVIYTNFLEYAELLNSSIFVLIAFLSFLFYGYQKKKLNKINKSVAVVVVTNLLLYFVLTYAVGFAFGFLKSPYSRTLIGIIKNLIGPFIFFTAIELLRYIFVSANKDRKFTIVIFSLALAFIESCYYINSLPLDTVYLVFVFATVYVIPAIVENLSLSYITYYVGLGPCLLYRLFIKLYIFIVPIVPNLGNYLSSISNVCLPFITALFSYRMISEYENGVEHDFGKHTFKLSDIPFAVCFLILFCLVAGVGPYHIVGIASNSMQPVFGTGDAVVLRQFNLEDIEVDDIIAFKSGDRVIVHRVVDIDKGVYITKGDNNNDSDDLYLTLDDIDGVVEFRIPYIAYPSVMISKYLN